MSQHNPFMTFSAVPEEDGTYHYVPVGDGFTVPRRFDAGCPRDGGGWIQLLIETDANKTSRCTRVSVHGADLTSDHLRFPLERLVPLAVARYAQQSPRETDPADLVSSEPLHARKEDWDRDRYVRFYEQYTADARRPRKGAPITDKQLTQVADLYRAAIEHGDPPTQTVAEQMRIPRSTAARWVTKARERGHLGPALRTTAGEQP
jgi:hypothetical protein